MRHPIITDRNDLIALRPEYWITEGVAAALIGTRHPNDQGKRLLVEQLAVLSHFWTMRDITLFLDREHLSPADTAIYELPAPVAGVEVVLIGDWDAAWTLILLAEERAALS